LTKTLVPSPLKAVAVREDVLDLGLHDGEGVAARVQVDRASEHVERALLHPLRRAPVEVPTAFDMPSHTE
jgi:hypothetical protein